jgi:membrane glycosyltransferase
MSQEVKFKYCRRCNKTGMHYREGASHIFHGIMSFITCGFWLFILIVVFLLDYASYLLHNRIQEGGNNAAE